MLCFVAVLKMDAVDGRQKNPSTDADLQEIVEDIVADETVTTRKLQVCSCDQAQLIGLPIPMGSCKLLCLPTNEPFVHAETLRGFRWKGPN